MGTRTAGWFWFFLGFFLFVFFQLGKGGGIERKSQVIFWKDLQNTWV